MTFRAELCEELGQSGENRRVPSRILPKNILFEVAPEEYCRSPRIVHISVLTGCIENAGVSKILRATVVGQASFAGELLNIRKGEVQKTQTSHSYGGGSYEIHRDLFSINVQGHFCIVSVI